MIELVKLAGIIDLDSQATGPMQLVIYSDLPGNAQAVRETRVFDASQGGGGRQVIRLKLHGTTKGHAFKFELANLSMGTNTLRLYGARFLFKNIGVGADWTWASLPVDPTPEEWSAIALPIDPTSEEWTVAPLPIDPTSDEWKPVALPIDPTSDEWSPWPLPIEPTPDLRSFVNLTVSP